MTSQSQKKARLEVPEQWKKSFSEKEITCGTPPFVSVDVHAADERRKVEYYCLPSDLERDIFQRVQLGVALTAAGM